MTDPTPSPAPTGRNRFPLLVAAAAAAAILLALAIGLVVTGSDDASSSGDAARIPPTFDPDNPPANLPEIGLPEGEPTTGEVVPDVALELWEGGEVTLADYTDGPLVVNFFASWCAPCVSEMPDFEEVHQEVGDRVSFLGVNREDSRDLAESLVERTGVTYPLATDTDDELLPALGAIVMPTTVFIDDTGTVIRVHSGLLTGDALRDAIDEEFGL